ncbi:MAG: hypothetical protein KDJ28_08205 [Candidatus Competibacteraceae bacterium]|nr:hypothetical protein [Candidatus Competibacteraceae bacterium]
MTDEQGFLQQVFGGLAAFAQERLAEHRHHQERLAAMRDAIEAVVDASEPRIRLVGSYADKLLNAVETASIYAEKVLKQLPPAITLDAHAWSRHPEVNAFFATVDDLRKMLAEDSGLRLFFQESGAERGYALMLMVKRETETFGAALRGDVLVRDVRQIRVSFSKHRLFFPTISEKRLREGLQQRMLVFLATRALERINEIRDQRSSLEEQRRRLQAQLRALRSHAQGLQPLLLSTDEHPRRETALEQRLAQVEEDLVAVRKRLGTLDDYLEQVRQVLSQPEKYLQARPLTLRLTRLGIKLSPESSEPGETLSLIELDSLGDQRIGALVRFSRQEALPPPPMMTTI